MKVEILLDAGEEYPSVFTVYRDDGNGHADIATRRNYVDDEKGWDMWRESREDLAKALDENAKLRELVGDLREYIAGNADACDFCPQLGTCENHPAPPPCKYELTGRDHAVLDFIADSLSELGVCE